MNLYDGCENIMQMQVGTGFSFSDDDGYARTEDDVAENLLK